MCMTSTHFVWLIIQKSQNVYLKMFNSPRSPPQIIIPADNRNSERYITISALRVLT